MYMGIYSAAFQRRWHPYSPVFGSTEAGVVNRFLFTFFFTLEQGVGGGEVCVWGGGHQGCLSYRHHQTVYIYPLPIFAPLPPPRRKQKKSTSVMVLFGEPVKWSQIS